MSEKNTCRCCNGSGVAQNNSLIGASLRRRRIDKDISVTRMADHLGMSKSMLSNLELGLRTWKKEVRRKYEQRLK